MGWGVAERRKPSQSPRTSHISTIEGVWLVFLNILIALSLLAVVVTFLMGMVAFSRNGEAAGKALNRAMAWRVKTQVVAICILCLSLWAKSAGA